MIWKMDRIDIDFHIHSRYSGATSTSMEIPLIAKCAELKGLHIVGTGDALNINWLRHIKKNLNESESGIYSVEGYRTGFIITTEVEDIKRVHHLMLFPSISSAEDFRERIYKYSKDIDRDGRPHLRLNGEQIVDYAREVNALVGPSHAFTPWTAIYKEYDSLSECYGDNLRYIKFLELGLSADTYMADRISELQDITFMSNSDAHSPQPHRLGREFNRILLKEITYRDIVNAIEYRNGRKFVLNVGLNPREGKYHLTACTKCYVRFKLQDAIGLRWKCPECGGRIKKGVIDRINELATWEKPHHPRHRPRYMHSIPLAEVISLSTGITTLTSAKIKDGWNKLVDRFGTEINILIDSEISEIKKIDPEAGRIIEMFRSGRIRYVAGGGGQYGRPTLKNEEDNFWGTGQRFLNEF